MYDALKNGKKLSDGAASLDANPYGVSELAEWMERTVPGERVPQVGDIWSDGLGGFQYTAINRIDGNCFEGHWSQTVDEAKKNYAEKRGWHGCVENIRRLKKFICRADDPAPKEVATVADVKSDPDKYYIEGHDYRSGGVRVTASMTRAEMPIGVHHAPDCKKCHPPAVENKAPDGWKPKVGDWIITKLDGVILKIVGIPEGTSELYVAQNQRTAPYYNKSIHKSEVSKFWSPWVPAVGEKVRVRKDIAELPDEPPSIDSVMRGMVQTTFTVSEMKEDNRSNMCVIYDGWFWLPKWLEPVIE